MAALETCPPLTRESVLAAHDLVRPFVHSTPVVTNRTLSRLASTPRTPEELGEADGGGHEPASPNIRLWFKCENLQRVGAFKARGAFNALSRLSDEQLARGVVTHSSGTYSPPPSQKTWFQDGLMQMIETSGS